MEAHERVTGLPSTVKQLQKNEKFRTISNHRNLKFCSEVCIVQYKKWVYCFGAIHFDLHFGKMDMHYAV